MVKTKSWFQMCLSGNQRQVVRTCFILLIIFISSCSNENESDSSELLARYNQLYSNSLATFKIQNISIPNYPLMDNIRLNNIVDSEVLVFHFSESHCQECVKQVAGLIKTYFKNTPSDVLILSSFQSRRTMKLYLSKLGLNDFNNYQVQFGLDQAEIEIAPLLFITDKNLRMINILLPHYSLYDQTEGYFQIISERFHNGYN